MSKIGGGLKLTSYSFRDWSFHKIFGEPSKERPVPLNRSIEGIPLIYQGRENTCVDCAITWVQQWRESSHPSLSWRWLAKISKTGPDGVAPGRALSASEDIGIAEDEYGKNASLHKTPKALYVKTNPNAIYQALKIGPVLLGFKDYGGFGPHMVAAYDVTEKSEWKCATWSNANIQAQDLVPFDMKPNEAILICDHPEDIDPRNVYIPFLTVLADKLIVSIEKIYDRIKVAAR